MAGRQSGKSVTGPHWLLREIQACGPGDYAIVGPTIELLKKKAIPAFLKLFEKQKRLGKYNKQDRVFIFSPEGLMRVFGSTKDECTVFVGYATKPESLESATYKAVWADEAGQPDFKQTSWEALVGRRAIHDGRILVSTTPYAFNWLKYDLYDKWLSGEANTGYVGPHSRYIDIIRFESTMNPTFSQAKFDQIRATTQGWRFDLFYRAIFTRPAGSIFDCFDRDLHCVPRRTIPRDWPRFQGVDFGNVNTASTWSAMDPETSVLYVYRTYHDGNKSVEEHLRDWNGLEEKFFEQQPAVFDKRIELQIPICYGGAPSEDDWRDEFGEAGYAINRPGVRDVEVGIARVYQLIKSGRLKFFDDLTKLIGEIEIYSRKVNESGEPLAEIEDKSNFHRVDSCRYLSFGVSLDAAPPSPLKVSRQAGNERVEPKRPEDDDPEEQEAWRSGHKLQSRRKIVRGKL